MRLQESIEEAREPILYCNSVCVCVTHCIHLDMVLIEQKFEMKVGRQCSIISTSICVGEVSPMLTYHDVDIHDYLEYEKGIIKLVYMCPLIALINSLIHSACDVV